MTKFQNPSFNSPANNKRYSENYDRVFGKSCEYEDEEGRCPNKKFETRNMCLRHLIETGNEPEKPETD